MARMFSDEELQEISKPLSQLLLDALDRGDDASVEPLLKQMAAAHATLHSLGVATLARIWGRWHRDFPEARVVAQLDRIGERLMEPYRNQVEAGEYRQTAVELMALFRHQYGARMTLGSSDSDTWEAALAPCGSGGVFLARGYEEKYPQWHRRTADGTPIYCRGCESLQRAVNRFDSELHWSAERGDEAIGACRLQFRGGREFATPSAQEVDELTKSRAHRALEAWRRGDRDIRHLVVNQQHDWQPWHDTLMVWNEYTFASCIELGGMDYLEACLNEGYDSAFDFIYQSMNSFADDRARLVALAQNWHYHIGAFRIEEEEDRFAFILDPCGSGGRLFREEMYKDMFHYGEDLAPVLTEKHPLTFQRDEFPTYCTHCASGNRDQFNGNPLVFVVDGHAQQRRGMPCRQYVWKKDAEQRVEARLLEQVAMEDLIPARQLP